MSKLLSLIKVRPAKEITDEIISLRQQNQILSLERSELEAKLDDTEGKLLEANHTIQQLRERYCDSARRRMLTPTKHNPAGNIRLLRELTSQLP